MNGVMGSRTQSTKFQYISNAQAAYLPNLSLVEIFNPLLWINRQNREHKQKNPPEARGGLCEPQYAATKGPVLAWGSRRGRSRGQGVDGLKYG